MTQHHSPPSNGGEPRRLVALTHRDFRLIWLGQLFSNVGSEMQLIAINWHIFTLRQMITPDRLRGRMTGVNMIFFMGGPQLGELEAGLVAAMFGAPVAIFTGGLATVLLTGWIAWKYPRLRNYQAGDYVNIEAGKRLK